MKLDLKRQAIVMRREGYIYAEIADSLHISRSTAKLWTNDAELSALQNEHLLKRIKELQSLKMRKLSSRKQAVLLEREKLLRVRAKSVVDNIKQAPDYNRLVCAIMYWCEGTKDVSAGIKFTNADPLLIQKFLHLLRSSFEIDEHKMRALIHLHEYHYGAKQLRYWSKVTGIPQDQFYKPYIKPHTGKNSHIDYPGCISVRYYDSSLGKLLKMIYSEYCQVS